MKRLFLIIASFLFLANSSGAQTPKPAKWTFTVKQISSDEAELVSTAKIDNGYHVYSQDISPDVGPIPTSFVFNADKSYTLAGKVTEGKPIEIYDPNFDAKLKYFSGEAVFVQRIKINKKKPFQVSGTLTFMVCDDRRCFPPEDLPFTFAVNSSDAGGAAKTGTSTEKK